MSAEIQSLERRCLLSGSSIAPALAPDVSSLILGYTPAQIRHAYGLDQITFGSAAGNGAGQTIAIIDPGDDPDFVSTGSPNFAASDLHLFDQEFGLPDPPSFKKVDESGGTDYPGDTSGTDEIAMDIEWAHAIAPAANILLVEARGGYNGNLNNAIEYAREQPGVSVISMSFGSNEATSDDLNDDAIFNPPAGHAGETFIASTGDLGAPGYYPAYSPKVLAVGGTSLNIDANSNYSSESGWPASGGGISTVEPKPAYQSGATQSATHRTIPDVSFDADEATGIAVLNSFSGESNPWSELGGTSLGAPAWSGILSIVNQGRATKGEGPLNGYSQTLPGLYSLPAQDFHDITTGNNGFSAGAGYDLVTGLGTPNGTLLIPDLVNYSSSGQISGSVFHDDSGDGSQQLLEPGFVNNTVFIDSNNNGVFDPGELSTQTDQWGSFAFKGLGPGTYRLRTAIPSGWAPTGAGAVQSITLNAGSNRAGVDFGFIRAGTGSLQGKVYNDLNGNGNLDFGEGGMAGIRVYLDVNGNGTLDAFEQSTLTDANGNYSFTGLGTSFDYRLNLVTPLGYLQTGPAMGSMLTAGQSDTFNFGLTTRSFVSGDVRESGDIPFVGWTVYLDSNDNGVLDAGEPSDITDINGNWQIGGLVPGTYTFREILRPGYAQTSPPGGALTITFTTLAFSNANSFVNAPAAIPQGSISGVVFNDGNGDSLQNGNEPGLFGITVYNDANNNGMLDAGEMHVMTGIGGGYSFTGLSAGSYKIREIVPAGWKQTTPANNFGWTLALLANQSLTGKNFGEQTISAPPPPSGGSIEGSVFNDLNGNGSLNAGETSRAGITIYNDANNNGKLDTGELNAMTDGSGNYSFNNLAAGNYKIREILPSGWAQTTPGNNFGWTLALSAAQNLTGINFGQHNTAPPPPPPPPPPPLPGSVTGIVFNDANGNDLQDSNEVGLSGWKVYLDFNNDGILDGDDVSTVTQTDGSYTFSGLHSGSYIVRVIAPKGWLQTAPAGGFGQHITVSSSGKVTGNAANFGEHQTSG